MTIIPNFNHNTSISVMVSGGFYVSKNILIVVIMFTLYFL